MKASIRHGAFLAVVVFIAAAVVSGVVVADLDADRQRPTLSAFSGAQTHPAGGAGPVVGVNETGVEVVEPAPASVFGSDEMSAAIAPAADPVGPPAAVVDPDEPDQGPVPGAGFEQVWSLVDTTGPVAPETPLASDGRNGEAGEVLSNTDVGAQQAAPKATSTAEPETIEVEHTVSRIPDPPDVGASSKRETFVVQPEVHDPWQAVRRCESHENYQINTGNGFFGAYQFTRSTWNWVAEKIGRQDLVGVRPDQASPAAQDRMAQALAFEVPGGGLHHWPVCGRLYG